MSQQMQYPHGPQAPAGGHGHQAARNGLGIAALVLGLIGALSGLIPLLFWLAGILGILALVFGFSGRGRAKRGQATNKGMATVGAVLGLVSLILSVVGAVITFTAVKKVGEEIDKQLKTSSAQPKDPSAKKDGGKAYKAGGAAAYDTGLNVTVSKPAPYTSDLDLGEKKTTKSFKVTVKLDNKGSEKIEGALVTVSARTGSDGKTAETIYDGKLGAGFSGTVQPGKTASADFGFEVPAGAKNLEVEVKPGFDHDANQWDLTL